MRETSLHTSEFTQELWTWDPDSKSPAVTLSANNEAAYFHTDPITGSLGSAGVRGNRGFSSGEHYWEVCFVEPPLGTSVMVGVGTLSAPLHLDNYQYVNLIGNDDKSWGLSYKGNVWHAGKSRQYCEPFYRATTVIGVHLNYYTGTLSFYRDGHCLGVAFTGLDQVGEELYPIISSTATNTELELGLQVCRYLSLEQKCCLLVARSLTTQQDAHCLPLPTSIQHHIMEMC